MKDEIKYRLKAGKSCYYSVQSLLSSRPLCKNLKIIIIKICTAKSRVSIPRHQRCLSSYMFLFLIKSAPWFFHYCCGIPLLLLPCDVHWPMFFGQGLSYILRKCLQIKKNRELFKKVFIFRKMKEQKENERK